LIEHEAVTSPAEVPKVNLGGIEEAVADKGFGALQNLPPHTLQK